MNLNKPERFPRIPECLAMSYDCNRSWAIYWGWSGDVKQAADEPIYNPHRPLLRKVMKWIGLFSLNNSRNMPNP